ncbi:MAG TPA: DUF4097 family beta strand repeat-containing protein [Pyrinomonadaceae bacterium]|nr:DUF4097 family beta strand repeat-containing protein [Pyrinomonadaceae bacterium]
MNKRMLDIIFCLLIVTGLFVPPSPALAQQVAPPQGGPQIVGVDSTGAGQQEGRVSFKLRRGGHVAVDNRTTGRIVIVGWDRDTVEAVATSERGAELVRTSVTDSPDDFILLKADYLKRDGEETARPAPTPYPAATPAIIVPPDVPPVSTVPAVTPPKIRPPENFRKPPVFSDGVKNDPPMRDGRPIEVHLEVRVPRYAEIELIKVNRSNVEVTNVDTPIVILGDKSNVVLRHVGQAEVRTRSGAVEIEDVRGLVEVTTASGSVRVLRAGGDVRVFSISGDMNIECVRGRVNVDSADGSIRLANVGGDVEASASNSNVYFAGPIREDGRYHLKTMSGAVVMALRDKPPGFTAALSSYRGTIENDFQLQIKPTTEQHTDGDVNRRLIGRHGDGQAQITLDSFDGKVKLGKLAPAQTSECQTQN